jgi:hypothetical protein
LQTELTDKQIVNLKVVYAVHPRKRKRRSRYEFIHFGERLQKFHIQLTVSRKIVLSKRKSKRHNVERFYG